MVQRGENGPWGSGELESERREDSKTAKVKDVAEKRSQRGEQMEHGK